VEENPISDKLSKRSIVQIDPINNERQEKVKKQCSMCGILI
jgi:hypothetical protein